MKDLAFRWRKILKLRYVVEGNSLLIVVEIVTFSSMIPLDIYTFLNRLLSPQKFAEWIPTSDKSQMKSWTKWSRRLEPTCESVLGWSSRASLTIGSVQIKDNNIAFKGSLIVVNWYFDEIRSEPETRELAWWYGSLISGAVMEIPQWAPLPCCRYSIMVER